MILFPGWLVPWLLAYYAPGLIDALAPWELCAGWVWFVWQAWHYGQVVEHVPEPLHWAELPPDW